MQIRMNFLTLRLQDEDELNCFSQIPRTNRFKLTSAELYYEKMAFVQGNNLQIIENVWAWNKSVNLNNCLIFVQRPTYISELIISKTAFLMSLSDSCNEHRVSN